MTTIESVILGVVEGLTEYLPISSTGHMIIAQSLLHIESSKFLSIYLVNIQFGAILAVIVLYLRRFLNFKAPSFYFKLALAFLPIGVLGLLLNKVVDELQKHVEIVAISLIVGGIVLVLTDRIFKGQIHDKEPLHTDADSATKSDPDGSGIKLTYMESFFVGCFQTLGMIPGMSRSAVTIIGGLTRKLTMREAAEFSFFLGVPTVAAAAVFKTFKGFKDIHGDEVSLLLIGNVVSFIVGMIAIKYFVSFISRHGMKWFGYYRILVGLAILLLPYIFHISFQIKEAGK
ncbi:MAG: undecaprenol kinase [Bacteroidetes bacterium]|nr:undecaprenol kinase [Bacteroidota bacterium]